MKLQQFSVLIIVSFSMFMEAVDTTILNTAIPVMSKSFHVPPIDLKLALISYLLSLAIFIPISGWIADKYGIKKVFISAIALFTLSSLWCGMTQSLSELIVARIIQGIGGSLTMPVGRLIILKTYPRNELISKMSVVVMVASLGMMLGPLLGGFIINHLSWRWVFWVNIPVGIIAVLLSFKALPAVPKIRVPPLDKFGFILFGSGLATLTFGLSTLSESSIPLSQSLITIGIAFFLLIGYLMFHSTINPIIRVDLLTIPTFQVSVIANLITRLSFGGVPFLLPLLLQIIFGYSAQLSGLLLAPVALGVLVAKPLALFLLRLLGYQKFLIVNNTAIAVILGLLATLQATTSLYLIGLLTFIYGFLIALQYTGMNSLAYANIQDEFASAATSIMSTIQQLSQSFGVAIAAILISFFTYESADHHLLTLKTFHDTFLVLGLLTFLSSGIFMRIKKGDGGELIGATH